MLLERMGKMQSATDDVAEYCKYDGFDGLKEQFHYRMKKF